MAESRPPATPNAHDTHHRGIPLTPGTSFSPQALRPWWTFPNPYRDALDRCIVRAMEKTPCPTVRDLQLAGELVDLCDRDPSPLHFLPGPPVVVEPVDMSTPC
jgi:hypothetical protein